MQLLSLSFPQLLIKYVAIVVTVCVVNPWLLIPAGLMMLCFLLFRAYYLKNSREIKRLEAVGEMKVVFLMLCC